MMDLEALKKEAALRAVAPSAPILTIASAIALFLYVKVIVVMYFVEPAVERPSVTKPSLMTSGVIGFGALATLVLGVVPGPLLDFLGQVGVFIR